MAIELNGIELTEVHRITTLESGRFIQHQVPGLEGNLSQDLGRQSSQLQIDGIFYGEEIEKDLKALRDVFLKREPVEFLAQVTGQAYAAKVIIDSLKVMDSGEQANQFTYQMIILEYIEPPSSSAVNAAQVDAFVEMEALEIMEMMEIPDMLSLGSIPELSNPVEPLKGALEPIQEASKAFVEASEGLKILLGN